MGDDKLIGQTETAFIQQFGLKPAREKARLRANPAGMIDLMKIPAQACR